LYDREKSIVMSVTYKKALNGHFLASMPVD
jgi:hypothetical protein